MYLPGKSCLNDNDCVKDLEECVDQRCQCKDSFVENNDKECVCEAPKVRFGDVCRCPSDQEEDVRVLYFSCW